MSARLTARLTAVESLHTEASEELDDATKECDDEERQAQQVREELATVRNADSASSWRQIVAKLNCDGPVTTGIPNAAGSSTF